MNENDLVSGLSQQDFESGHHMNRPGPLRLSKSIADMLTSALLMPGRAVQQGMEESYKGQPPSEDETIKLANTLAQGAVTGGMPLAESGAVGMAGGKLYTPSMQSANKYLQSVINLTPASMWPTVSHLIGKTQGLPIEQQAYHFGWNPNMINKDIHSEAAAAIDYFFKHPDELTTNVKGFKGAENSPEDVIQKALAKNPGASIFEVAGHPEIEQSHPFDTQSYKMFGQPYNEITPHQKSILMKSTGIGIDAPEESWAKPTARSGITGAHALDRTSMDLFAKTFNELTPAQQVHVQDFAKRVPRTDWQVPAPKEWGSPGFPWPQGEAGERAQEAGFTTPVWHGKGGGERLAKPYSILNTRQIGEPGRFSELFTAHNPDIADMYSYWNTFHPEKVTPAMRESMAQETSRGDPTIMPFLLKAKDTPSFNAKGADYSEANPIAMSIAQRDKAPIVTIHNVGDEPAGGYSALGTPQSVSILYGGNNAGLRTRSPFAAFKNLNVNDLLAGLGAGAVPFLGGQDANRQ